MECNEVSFGRLLGISEVYGRYRTAYQAIGEDSIYIRGLIYSIVHYEVSGQRTNWVPSRQNSNAGESNQSRRHK